MNVSHTFIRLSSAAATVAAVAVIAGCASPKKGSNAELEQARGTVQAVADDPNVVRLASPELGLAQQTIVKADGALAAGVKADEISHMAYLARQRAEIAKVTAWGRMADEKGKAASDEAAKLGMPATAPVSAPAPTMDMPAKLRAIGAQQTERGYVVILGDALFAVGRADLTASSAAHVDALAGFLKEFPERRVLVEGNTDSTGADAMNLRLSEQRANAVTSALVSRGVDAARIQAVGYGEEFPIGDNATREGRSSNRRVDVVITDEAGNLRARR